jgi:hypothetical protein
MPPFGPQRKPFVQNATGENGPHPIDHECRNGFRRRDLVVLPGRPEQIGRLAFLSERGAPVGRTQKTVERGCMIVLVRGTALANLTMDTETGRKKVPEIYGPRRGDERQRLPTDLISERIQKNGSVSHP